MGNNVSCGNGTTKIGKTCTLDKRGGDTFCSDSTLWDANQQKCISNDYDLTLKNTEVNLYPNDTIKRRGSEINCLPFVKNRGDISNIRLTGDDNININNNAYNDININNNAYNIEPRNAHMKDYKIGADYVQALNNTTDFTSLDSYCNTNNG